MLSCRKKRKEWLIEQAVRMWRGWSAAMRRMKLAMSQLVAPMEWNYQIQHFVRTQKIGVLSIRACT